MLTTVEGSMALTCPLPHFLDDELYCSADELETDSRRLVILLRSDFKLSVNALSACS
jgi:hypothetical protein